MKVSAKSSRTWRYLINKKDKKQDTWEAGATELEIATASRGGAGGNQHKTKAQPHNKKTCCIAARLSGKRRVSGFFAE